MGGKKGGDNNLLSSQLDQKLSVRSPRGKGRILGGDMERKRLSQKRGEQGFFENGGLKKGGGDTWSRPPHFYTHKDGGSA